MIEEARIFSEADYAVLAKARAILGNAEVKSWEAAREDDELTQMQARDLGKFSEACDNADDAIFNVLNVASSYLRFEGADEAIG